MTYIIYRRTFEYHKATKPWSIGINPIILMLGWEYIKSLSTVLKARKSDGIRGPKGAYKATIKYMPQMVFFIHRKVLILFGWFKLKDLHFAI